MFRFSDKLLSWLMGIALILFVWHNPYQPLKEYLFLPWIGLVLILCVEGIVWKKHGFNFGEKKIWILLAVIALSIVASGFAKYFRAECDLNQAIAIGCSGVMLFGIYPTVRRLGKDVFKPFAWSVIIEALSIVIYGALHDWGPNGGLLSPTNYDIAIGLLIFGYLVSDKKTLLLPFLITGIYFSGAAEGLFVIAVLFIAWLAGNWNKLKQVNKDTWLMLTVSILVIAVAIPTTYNNIWSDKLNGRIEAAYQAIWDSENRQELLLEASSYRIGVGEYAGVNDVKGNWNLSPILPFGHGYNMTDFYIGIPHNIALIIIEQVGIGALVAWIFLALLGLCRWRYLWIGFIALGIFDHFIWTQAAPWLWAIAGGTSLMSNNKLEIVK